MDSPENVFENLKEDEGNVEFAVERRETIQIEEIKESSTISQDFERKDEKVPIPSFFFHLSLKLTHLFLIYFL